MLSPILKIYMFHDAKRKQIVNDSPKLLHAKLKKEFIIFQDEIERKRVVL